MFQWLDCIILLIVGSTVTAIVFIGVWPNEHTFDEGVRCSVIAMSNLRNKPDLVVEVFAEEGNTIVLDSVGDDVIHFLRDETGLTAANAIDSDGEVSSSIKMICHGATNWWVKSQVGVWVDGGTN